MTTPPQLADSTGRPFPLDRKLAAGGEGAVFTLPGDPTRVAKVYHKPPTAQTVEKLTAMVGLANPRLLGVAAWPSGLLYAARTRQLAGFVMPRLTDCQPIQHLYNPVMRLKHYPRAGWAFQVRAALNAAAAFDEVHKAGCLVGDVNQSNVQVSPQALVRLIDCDSFQVRTGGRNFLCEVGVPHYTPPELQGRSFRGLVRTENHDRFGLAVLVYQLLFIGRHPYAGVFGGRGDPSFEELIAQFRFAQGPLAHTWQMAPPPFTPTFADIPPDLGLLFRRAFERGSETGTRPRPAEWMTSLRQLERATAGCVTDPGHTYWAGANGCVWCRLAEKGGPEYYFGVSGDAGTFEVDEARLREVQRRLNSMVLTAFPFDPDRYVSDSVRTPEQLPEGLIEHRNTVAVLSVAIGVCVLMLPFGLVRGFVSVIGLLGAVVFGGWLAVLMMRSPWQRELRRRRQARQHAHDALDDLEHEWREITRRYRTDHAAASRSVTRLVSECRGLASQYQRDLQSVAANAEAAARERYLRLHSLVDADIPQVGVGLKQVLAAHGVYTAADVDWHRVSQISGFGRVRTDSVVAWRNRLLTLFRFDRRTGVSPAEQRTLAVRFRTRQNQLMTQIDRQLAELEALAPRCRTKLDRLVSELRSAVAAWEQAVADLRVMTHRR